MADIFKEAAAPKWDRVKIKRDHGAARQQLKRDLKNEG